MLVLNRCRDVIQVERSLLLTCTVRTTPSSLEMGSLIIKANPAVAVGWTERVLGVLSDYLCLDKTPDITTWREQWASRNGCTNSSTNAMIQNAVFPNTSMRAWSCGDLPRRSLGIPYRVWGTASLILSGLTMGLLGLTRRKMLFYRFIPNTHCNALTLFCYI